MNQTTRKRTFKAEVKEVLQLMIHSLYSNKEIFLRELISNASDACDKLRFEALQDQQLLSGAGELAIEIEFDKEARTLTVRDNGIGMTLDEVSDNIGTIARSGTREFLKQAAEKSAAGDASISEKLIGQFGVGFYSSFIVADKVELLTRRAGTDAEEGVAWASDGTGKYTIGNVLREQHGTEVILHLKETESEFLDARKLRSLIGRYSDHIGFPIRLREPLPAGQDSDDQEPGFEWKSVNQAAALWTRPKADIKDEEYQSFYKHVSHDFNDALAWAHNNVEGQQNYTSLLYVPEQAPMDFLMQRDERKGLRLYVKRVFIMDAAEQLLPHYLRFVSGVVDSADLPLNVSREILQENDQLRKIRAAVIKRSLDLLTSLASKDPEKFNTFWDAFGNVLKEGIVEDGANREKIAALLRFTSSHDTTGGQRVGLADYVARMPADQDTIWFITADSLAAASNSPHLEIFRKKGIEVLLMHDRIDEWMMAYFTEFDGKPLRSVAKGDVQLDEAADDASEDKEAEDAVLKKMADVLGGEVSQVRNSRRLTDSASCLVLGEADMALHLRRMLEQAGQKLPDTKPVLEINRDHPLVRKLETTESDEDFKDWTHLLHEQAVLAEGGQLPDPARFVQRLNRLILNQG